MKKPYLMISALVIALASCQKTPGMNNESAVKEEVFGKLPDGRETARLVASWSTTEADVDAFLAALKGH